MVFCMGLLAQCAKNKGDYIGPQYVPAPKGFSVKDNLFTSAYASVNFQTNHQSFLSSFSSNVQWYILITGLQSGAIKRLSGISQSLDSANTAWDGSADSVFFFKAGESCAVTLSFLGGTFTLADTFTISKTKIYKGLLIDDFEEGTTGKVGLNYTYIATGAANVKIDLTDSTIKAQGNSSLLLQGTDLDTNYWITGVSTDSNVLAKKVASVNADSLFINLSVYGIGQSEASLEIKFEEDDAGTGTFNASLDDVFHYLIQVSWTGWKSISIPYSSFTDDNPGIGDGIAEPARILQMSITLVSLPPVETLSVNADFVILTTGKSLW